VSDNYSYRVGFDADTSGLDEAVTAVQDLDTALQEVADKPIEFDVDDAKVKAALDTLNTGLDQTETEVEGTIAAVKALGDVLGPSFDSTRLEGFVTDLRQMGVEFDQIEANAKEFADVIQRVDNVKMTALEGGLDRVGTGLDRVRSNSDQSRSVLANMAGNSAQDLGELGGVVGTLGVGIGQLAEYAVDGNIALSNLAKVAGPMLGVAAAGLLVNKAVGDMAKVSESASARVDVFTEALIEGRDAWEDFREQVEETGELTFEDDGIFGTGFGGAVRNVIPHLATLGLTLEDFQRIVEDPAMEEGFRDLLEQWKETGSVGTVTANALLQVLDAVDQYQASAADGATAAADINTVLVETASSLDDVNAAWAASGDSVGNLNDLWSKLLADMADGRIDDSAAAWDRLRDVLDLSQEEMADLARQKLADKLEADAEAAAELAARLDDARQAIADLLSEDLDVGSIIGEALDAQDFRLDFQAAKVAVDDAFEELQAYVDENGPLDWSALLDISQIDPSALEADQIALLQSVRDTFQEGIATAFETGGIQSAEHFAETFRTRLAEAGGPDNSQLLYEFMGLDANGSVTATIQPYIDELEAERARSILDAVAGTDLADARVAAIQIAIDQGRLPGEIASLAAQIAAADVGLAIYPTVDEDTTQDEIDLAQAFLDQQDMGVNVAMRVEDADAKTGGSATDAINRLVAAREVPTSLELTNEKQFNTAVDTATAARTVTVRYVADLSGLPSLGELQSRYMGGVRVPIDMYVRHTPRIDGDRIAT
jgi:hypothetical protein